MSMPFQLPMVSPVSLDTDISYPDNESSRMENDIPSEVEYAVADVKQKENDISKGASPEVSSDVPMESSSLLPTQKISNESGNKLQCDSKSNAEDEDESGFVSCCSDAPRADDKHEGQGFVSNSSIRLVTSPESTRSAFSTGTPSLSVKKRRETGFIKSSSSRTHTSPSSRGRIKNGKFVHESPQHDSSSSLSYMTTGTESISSSKAPAAALFLTKNEKQSQSSSSSSSSSGNRSKSKKTGVKSNKNISPSGPRKGVRRSSRSREDQYLKISPSTVASGGRDSVQEDVTVYYHPSQLVLPPRPVNGTNLTPAMPIPHTAFNVLTSHHLQMIGGGVAPLGAPIPQPDPVTYAYAAAAKAALSSNNSGIFNANGATASTGGRRTIRLRLVEEETHNFTKRLPFLRRKRSNSLETHASFGKNKAAEDNGPDHGTIVVSWYEGTTTTELQDHVRRSVARKLGREVDTIRILDEEVYPHEEVVLSPFIPDISKFLLKFTIAKTITSYGNKAPDSPSRAPTPHTLENLPLMPPLNLPETKQTLQSVAEVLSSPKVPSSSGKPLIITKQATPTQEKKNVVFVLANYFILFLSLIAISAEMHERGPEIWGWIENSVNSVNSCAIDRDSLYECVSSGDFSGILASFLLWVTSKASRRFFLFGFDSVQKLWTVIYEALVTAICWGTSYIFIRRGFNPDTRQAFIEKYWKDAVYGSLAGFNAAFMKAVMKNLIPQEAIEEVMVHGVGNNQLRIVNWFANISR